MTREDITRSVNTITDPYQWAKVADEYYAFARKNNDKKLLRDLEWRSIWLSRREEADADCL